MTRATKETLLKINGEISKSSALLIDATNGGNPAWLIELYTKISNLAQEAKEALRIQNGEIRLGEHQNIAPAERRPEA